MFNALLWMMLIAIITFQSCTSNSKSERKPNIVFILVDDLGKEWVSAYGAEDITTPNIDALAESGVMFNNVYSMPQCTPTRVTLLTGQYPFRHGWVNHWDVPRWGGGAHFDETVNPSLGIEMKKAGYTNFVAGKWQIDDFRVEPDALKNNGFDDYCMWTGYEGGIPASANRYQDPYLFTNEGSKTYEGEFGPDVLTESIVRFIKKQADDPFFVYYPMVLTHTPFVNTPDEEADDKLGKHKAMVRYADKLTGKIVKALDDSGQLENTIIIWTTDNGTTGQITGGYQGRKVKGGKSQVTESGIAEPFIASWKGHIKRGQVSEALIDFTDIYPTFIDIAGGEINSDLNIDGQSFKDVLFNNNPKSNRSWIMSMGGGNKAKLTENGVENQFRFRDRVVRTERYKMYIGSDRQAQKFIDLVEDPEEQVNLIGQLTDEQRKTFDALIKVVEGQPVMDADPKYRPNPPQEWDVDITAESQTWKQ
jgi:arylsulfatase A-like enzyme